MATKPAVRSDTFDDLSVTRYDQVEYQDDRMAQVFLLAGKNAGVFINLPGAR